MLKCNQLYHLALDIEEPRPFWRHHAYDIQRDIQCAATCGSALHHAPAPPPLTDAASARQTVRSRATPTRSSAWHASKP